MLVLPDASDVTSTDSDFRVKRNFTNSIYITKCIFSKQQPLATSEVPEGSYSAQKGDMLTYPKVFKFEVALPSSQELVTRPDREPDNYSPHPRIPSKIIFNIITHLKLGQ